MPYFTVCQHGSFWLTRFWLPSLWGTSITGNLIWDFDWHCLPDLISNVHMEHKVVKCNPCQTQRKYWKNCNKIIKAYNLTKLQMLTPLQSHDEYLYNWHLHFIVARLILSWTFWQILFVWCVGTQNARWWRTEYHSLYSNFFHIT